MGEASLYDPERLDVDVAGGSLRALRWGVGERTVLALHGISASAMSFPSVVRHLDPDVTLVAPDLRGRGRSGGLPGPYGFAQHADDAIAVLDRLGVARAVVVGESMGAYVAVVLAARHPDRVERVVLVDGGIPLPIEIPEGVDVEMLATAGSVGATSRLGRTFATRDEYLDVWRDHPALLDSWGPDLEAYLAYDIAASSEPELRSSVDQDAIRGDLLDVFAHPQAVPEAFRSLRCPVVLLRATRGMNDEPEPGLPDALVAHWQAELPQLVDEVIDDTNHYTICLGDRGSRRIADHVCGRVPEARS